MCVIRLHRIREVGEDAKGERSVGQCTQDVHTSLVDNSMIMHKSTIYNTGFDSCIVLQIGIIIDPRWLVGKTQGHLK